MKLLYAEDEPAMAEAVTDILRYHKYSVDTVRDGREALDYALVEKYDGIILDVMMPKLSGLEVLQRLRQEGCRTPVLLLTAKSEVEDRIEGLDAGADDYLPKPFEAQELMARVRAMLRRRASYVPDIVSFGDLSLDKGKNELSCNGKTLRLTGKTYQLMELFMENPHVLFSVNQLMERVWGWDSEAEINVVWVNISQLRKRLSELDAGAEIHVHRGSGYSLENKA